MHPRVEPDAEAIVDDLLENPVSCILCGQSVTVVNEHFLAIYKNIERRVISSHSQLFPEIIPYPEIVIPDQVVHGHTAPDKFIQRREDPVKALRNDSPVFDPRIEEITHDEELACILPDRSEECDQAIFLRPLFLFRPEPQVRIGYEVRF